MIFADDLDILYETFLALPKLLKSSVKIISASSNKTSDFSFEIRKL